MRRYTSNAGLWLPRLIVIAALVVLVLALLARDNPAGTPGFPGLPDSVLNCLDAYGAPVRVWWAGNNVPLTAAEWQAFQELAPVGVLQADYAHTPSRWVYAGSGEPVDLQWDPAVSVGVSFDYDAGPEAFVLVGFWDQAPGEAYVIVALRALGWHCCGAYVVPAGAIPRGTKETW